MNDLVPDRGNDVLPALAALAARRGLRYLSAGELPAAPPLVKHLSPKYLRQYVACPIAINGAAVTIAVADPDDS